MISLGSYLLHLGNNVSSFGGRTHIMSNFKHV